MRISESSPGTILIEADQAMTAHCRTVGRLAEIAIAPDDIGEPSRLYPRAYLDPAEDIQEAVWQLGNHERLRVEFSEELTRYTASLDVLEADGCVELHGEDADAWMTVMNLTRLKLHQDLGVTDADVESEDETTVAYAMLYAWMGEICDVLCRLIAGPM
ncbi:MAG: DUF2017 family protein [Actinobacteria bacterium]|nr:DUF2017 family protein [Actinomycetota bacterium]MCB9388526.1 DUF2017 family protein [Acidimicrobiia bacterium]